MAELARHIPIDKNSELGKALDEARAAGQPVVLEVNGYSYRFLAQPQAVGDPWRDYDPARVKRALAESAGSLKGIDRDRLLKEIYEARSQDSHGRPA